jgi:predicted transposase/invertase (TIGR01784 family)
MSKAKLTSQNAKTATAAALSARTAKVGKVVRVPAAARARAAAARMREERFIDPCTDFGFKRLFGRDSTKDLLASFLNSVLPPAYHVKSFKFLNPETYGINTKAKKVVYDILCKNRKGEQFIVEMQVEDEKNFEERSVLYLARAVSEQIPRGGDYRKLKAVCFIGLMKFKSGMRGLLRKPWQKVFLRNEDGGTFSEKMQMYFLQMPLFEKTEGELETTADKWFYLLKHLPKLADRPVTFRGPAFKKVFEEAEYLAMPEADRINYDLDRDSKYIAESVRELREDKIREETRAAKAELAATATELAATTTELAAATAKLAESKAAVAAERAAATAKLAEAEAATAAKLAAAAAAANAKAAAAKLEAVRKLKVAGVPLEVLAQSFGLSPTDIAKLQAPPAL